MTQTKCSPDKHHFVTKTNTFNNGTNDTTAVYCVNCGAVVNLGKGKRENKDASDRV